MKLRFKHFLIVGWLLVNLIIAKNVNAAITELRGLDFGEVAIVDNSAVFSLSIDRIGNISFDPAFRIIRRGQPGEYEASGFAGNVQLFVSANIISGVMNPGQVSGEYPNLISLDVAPSIRTESDGTALITVGGTIQTSGSNSLNFIDATYSSDIQVIINF